MVQRVKSVALACLLRSLIMHVSGCGILYSFRSLRLFPFDRLLGQTRIPLRYCNTLGHPHNRRTRHQPLETSRKYYVTNGSQNMVTYVYGPGAERFTALTFK